jgi:hypothetical protein
LVIFYFLAFYGIGNTLFIFICFYYHIVVVWVHCDKYKSSYSIS